MILIFRTPLIVVPLFSSNCLYHEIADKFVVVVLVEAWI